VDAEAEYLIQEALDEVLKGRTALVMAHRLSTIGNADKIMALEGGALARWGTTRGPCRGAGCTANCTGGRSSGTGGREVTVPSLVKEIKKQIGYPSKMWEKRCG
jgi:ATP-binding cassette subfamily B protein